MAAAERLTTVTTWISDPKSALVEFAVGRAGAVRHYRGAAGHRPVGSVDDDPDLQHNQRPEEREPYSLEISMPRHFAAGVVRQGSVKRLASGVGEGAMAVSFIQQ